MNLNRDMNEEESKPGIKYDDTTFTFNTSEQPKTTYYQKTPRLKRRLHAQYLNVLKQTKITSVHVIQYSILFNI